MRHLLLTLLLICVTAEANLQRTIGIIKGLTEPKVNLDGIVTDPGEKVVIMVIDMQTSFSQIWGQSDVHNIIDRQCQLMAAFNDNENVYFMEVNYVPADDNFNFGQTVDTLREQMVRKNGFSFHAKSEDSAFRGYSFTTHIYLHENSHFEDISPEDDEFLVIDSTIKDYLNREGIKTIVPTGCFSSSCVRKTALDAMEQGYSVVADRDLMVEHDLRNRMIGETPEREAENIATQWNHTKRMFPEKLNLQAPAESPSSCIITLPPE